jgi:hypothetical protein
MELALSTTIETAFDLDKSTQDVLTAICDTIAAEAVQGEIVDLGSTHEFTVTITISEIGSGLSPDLADLPPAEKIQTGIDLICDGLGEVGAPDEVAERIYGLSEELSDWIIQ